MVMVIENVGFLDIVLLIVQIATLAALIIYVVKTWHMASASKKSSKISENILKEMKEARDQETRPYVVVYFDMEYSKRQIIHFCVKNVGKGIAKNVKLSVKPSFEGKYRDKLNSMPFIKDGISILLSGQERRTIFDELPSYLRNNYRLTYKVKVSYSGGLKTDLRDEEQTLDLSDLKGLIFDE